MDSSFADQEKRFILAEMIKASQIDVDAMVSFIKTYGIAPDWLEMQIPHGRTVNQCRQAAVSMGIETPPHILSQHQQQHYRQLGQQHTTQQPQKHQQNQPLQFPLPTAFTAKRKTSSDSSEHGPKRLAVAPTDIRSASQPRNIQPRPTGNDFVSAIPSPTTAVPSPHRNVPKKRGRPSRADKDAQARASGLAGYSFPHLAPASKPIAVSEVAASTSFEAPARTTPETHNSSTETREELRNQRSLDESPQLKQEPNPTPLKPKISSTNLVSQENAPDPRAALKTSTSVSANPPLSSRVAVADLLKAQAPTVVNTGV